MTSYLIKVPIVGKTHTAKYIIEYYHYYRQALRLARVLAIAYWYVLLKWQTSMNLSWQYNTNNYAVNQLLNRLTQMNICGLPFDISLILFTIFYLYTNSPHNSQFAPTLKNGRRVRICFGQYVYVLKFWYMIDFEFSTPFGKIYRFYIIKMYAWPQYHATKVEEKYIATLQQHSCEKCIQGK